MKQHYILSVLLFPVLAALIFVLAPIIALVMVFLMDHGIMKAYYVMWRKVRRYKNETKKLVERQVRRFVYGKESSV